VHIDFFSIDKLYFTSVDMNLYSNPVFVFVLPTNNGFFNILYVIPPQHTKKIPHANTNHATGLLMTGLSLNPSIKAVAASKSNIIAPLILDPKSTWNTTFSPVRLLI